MGLPESGKTTFLAALWHLIEADETECKLKLDGYRGDLTYLNKIAEAWRTFQKVPRTSLVGDVDVSINLLNRETGVRGTAYFPDIAGEVFDRQVIERRCRPEFVEEVSTDDGILLFISADVREDSLSVVELNSRIQVPVGALAPIGLGSNDSIKSNYEREWEQDRLPVQVKIVQILSDLRRRPFEQRRRRIAVLVSAWDLTTGMGLAPGQWLANHLPLVDQFLKTNAQSFQYQIYGVSAQGVDLGNATAVDVAARLTPSRRIQIIGPEGAGHDLTIPLVWLMSAQE